MKPSFDYMFNTPLKIFKKLKKSQKAFLGFDLVPPKDEFTRRRRRSDFFENLYQNLINKNLDEKIIINH